MTYLLDVNLILAGILESHPQHLAAFGWLAGKSVAVCPLVELGFIRISTQPKAFNIPMHGARELLRAFLEERKADRVADDLPALESAPNDTKAVTDAYLAALAQAHGLKLATFDGGITHAAAETIPA